MLKKRRRCGDPIMPFFSRGFILLWQGQLVSQFGNQAFFIATTYFTLEETGSTTLVGMVMMASTVPLAVLGPLGGAVADRHSRRSILIVADLLRALAVGGLGVFVLWHPEVRSFHVVLFIAVAGINGVMEALFTPAVQAIIPDLVPNDRLAAANAASQLSSQASVLTGQAIGGVLYLIFGAAGLLLIDALSFGYAGLATWFIPRDRKPAPPGVGLGFTMRRCVVDTREGLAYIKRQRGMIPVLVVFAGVNFLFMPVFVLLPLYVRSVLGAGADWYGFLLAGAGGGALCGASLAGLLGKVRAVSALVGVCVAGIACSVLVLATTSRGTFALPALVAIGVFSSLINVTVITRLQLAVPTELRGRVMALVVAVSTAAVPVGMGLGGVMGDLWRDSLGFVFGACGAAIAVLAAMSVRMPGFGDVLNAPDART
jgi:MFS family permease